MPPILIDKKLGWTSQNAISKYKASHSEVQKIGHIGTLDPLATGLLVAFANQETKLISQYTNLKKTYIATFCIGLTTPSLDSEFWPFEEDFEKDFLGMENLKNPQQKNDLGKYLGKDSDDRTGKVFGDDAKDSIRKNSEIVKNSLGFEGLLGQVKNLGLKNLNHIQGFNFLDGKNLYEKTQFSDNLEIWKDFLEEALIGQFWQTPPVFSAVKKNGKKGYQIAREVMRKTKNIQITEQTIQNEAQNTVQNATQSIEGFVNISKLGLGQTDTIKDLDNLDSMKITMADFEKSKQKMVEIFNFDIKNMEIWSKLDICRHYLKIDQKIREENQKWKNYNWQEDTFLDYIKKCCEKSQLQAEKNEFSAQVFENKYLIIKAEIEVSSGTYIRSIARDLGVLFESSGFLLELRRTKVGDFELLN